MDSTPRPMASHNNLHAVLFQATSAEYLALCVQSYQLARQVLLGRLRDGTYRNPAIVFDLDETILDNSPYQAWLIKSGANFDEDSTWRAWCDLGRAPAVPGSVEFVRFAISQNVTPIFITSRQNVTRNGTASNLEKLGLLSEEERMREEAHGTEAANAFQTRLFMKRMPKVEVDRPFDKESFELGNKFLQRAFVERVRDFEVILSVGDNLADYAEYYGRVYNSAGMAVVGQHPNAESRRFAVMQDMRLLGRDFILIPNATYGGWLRAFEANMLGASDELATTGLPVREGLKEPQGLFTYGQSKSVTALGPKLDPTALRIWTGPT